MSTKAGALLWNRRFITLAPGFTTIDTGLRQVAKSFAGMSPGEPTLGVEAAPPGPPDGATPASRIQVIPMAPLGSWTDLTHSEPFVDPATGTVKVTFNNASPGSPPPSVDINVLFWDPHSLLSPGEANTYNPAA